MQNHRLFSWVIFTGLAVLIMGPLLLPGYILTLDLSWGPHLGNISVSENGWALHQTLVVLTHIFPSWLIEKFVLISLFIIAGVGLQWLSARTSPGWPSYIGGALYVANPFTYERFMAGQWLVLAGYALMPWFVASLVRLIDRPSLGRTVKLTLWSIALALTSLHAVGMAALISIIFLVVQAWQNPATIRRAAPWLMLVAGLCLAAAAIWLVPLVLHRSSVGRTLAGINTDQYRAFATTGGSIGAPLNVLTLQGFWGDGRGLVAPASSIGWSFWLGFGIIATLVIVGLGRTIHRRDPLGIALACAAIVAWLLAIGVAWPPSALITNWLVAHVAWYRGYREPEKWAAVLALSYAYFVTHALALAKAYLRGFWRSAALTTSVLLPFIWVPLLFWGAAGQLTSVDYPLAWYQLNQKLSQLPAAPTGHPDTVMFPWHQYLYLDFARRTVANPVPNFFDRPVIISADPELPGLTPDPAATLANSVQNNVINQRFFWSNAGSRLSALGVHYIVLLKVSDQSAYSWLNTQSDLRLIAETPAWQLFQTSSVHP